MMRDNAFRYCMLAAALALGTLALAHFIRYGVILDVALDNSGVAAALQASIRSLWLAFGLQVLLIGALFALVAFRPRALSREVIVLLGLLQLLEAVLLFAFAGNLLLALLLAIAAFCVLGGAVIWPTSGRPAASEDPPA